MNRKKSNKSKRCVLLLFFILGTFFQLYSQEQVAYPYPILRKDLLVDDTIAEMSYMNVSPLERSNGKTVLLLHGKNFSGYYWKDVIARLVEEGFHVIAPDQVGWGRSDKPLIHYSFHTLARTTALLLDSLNVNKVIVIGHSMGGMLATRFSLMYPERVEKLVLENPIGLEDYRRFVPSQPLDKLIEKEMTASYESYKKYQQSYYPLWKPAYEQYVQAQAESLNDPDFDTVAKVNALTYVMIYEQPVCYEWDRIQVPTLLIIGQSDRTVVGKDLLTEAQKKIYGQYPALGRKTKSMIKNSKLIELPGIGHIPHIQDTALFFRHLLPFIK
jgi:pimeloyl-ACP methyl ester carboxylesterase